MERLEKDIQLQTAESHLQKELAVDRERMGSERERVIEPWRKRVRSE
jgi:hypothetical protein